MWSERAFGGVLSVGFARNVITILQDIERTIFMLFLRSIYRVNKLFYN